MLGYKIRLTVVVIIVGVTVCHLFSNIYSSHKSIVLKTKKGGCSGRQCANQKDHVGSHRNTSKAFSTGNLSIPGDKGPALTLASTSASKRMTQPHQQDIGRKTRFILPLIQNNVAFGNNVQYRLFMFTVGQALLHNRTVVAIPFFDNGSSGWGYSLESMRPFDKTFNIDSLKELVPVATLDQFRRQCNNAMEIVRQDIRVAANFNYSQSFYESIYNITFVSDSLSPEPTSLLRSEERCVAVYYTRTDPKARLAMALNESMFSSVTQHLKPTVPRAKMCKKIVQEICNGKPYLAVHYRNRTGEVCMFKESIFDLCDELLGKNEESAQQLVGAIYTVWRTRQFRCIYVAHPDWSQRFSYLLRRRLPEVHIVNSYDILKMDIDGMSVYKRDNYYLSLLEQDICTDSEVFIGWSISFWDKIVMARRAVLQKESLTFGSVLGIEEGSFERAWKENME